MGKVKNFARFYAILNTLQTGNKNDLKEELVKQFTDGRTSSLREMSLAEYNAMCNSIDTSISAREKAKAEIKTHRSAVLKRMQRLGIDTTDWEKIDKFCLNPRIAGKRFVELSIDELKALIPKLIAISKKDKEKQDSDSGSIQPTSTESNINMIMAYHSLGRMMRGKSKELPN